MEEERSWTWRDLEALILVLVFTVLVYLLSMHVHTALALSAISHLYIITAAMLYFFAHRNPSVGETYESFFLLFIIEGLTGVALVALVLSGLYGARYVVIYAVQLGLILAACRAWDDLGSLRLRWPRTLSSLVLAVVGGLLFGSFMVSAGEGIMEDHLSAPLWGLLQAIVLAPLTEELLFRGLMYTKVRREFPIIAAYAVSGVFAIVHLKRRLSVPALFGIFAYGLVATMAMDDADSILPPVIMHATANAVIYSGLIGLALA
ncbi:MAG: CPBP family intramembrane metalloprotease [Candidatus Undinarchaeales archaeon]|jgi:membrane protease YdiL (CAAX protease family)|nr:CPBP family intramembrane metalloprotease [Candidatus Undinarchaeales archaeon]MDP7494006.1 CPBP family intramembrane metalloprotease [Candidatus Undinarchaeales archaeon]